MSLIVDQSRQQQDYRLPQLDFRVDEVHCARQLLLACSRDTIGCTGEIRPRLEALQASVKTEVSEGLDIFTGKTPRDPFHEEDQRREMWRALKFISETPGFDQWVAEAQASVRFLTEEWKQNAQNYSDIFSAVTNLDLSKMKFEINVVHPALPAGMNLGGSSCIEWRYVGEKYPEYLSSDYFPHYNGVYICHEILHHEKLLGSGISEHAVIQLATDNEMRKRLTGIDYPPFIGHPADVPNMTNFHLDWLCYLEGKTDKTVLDFARSMVKKFE